VHHETNVVGPNVAKFRYQKGWTQDELVGKLQLLGCYMTRDILANIETRRGPVSDRQIEFFAEVFGVAVADLFPQKRHVDGHIVGLIAEIVTRHRHRHNGCPRTRSQGSRRSSKHLRNHSPRGEEH
jgi:transcriptional regulator with XRE-family HTH domain